MYTAGINVHDLQWDNRKYDWPKVYAENKRALVVFAEEYSRTEPFPPKVIFQSMHPGWVKTDLVHSMLPKFEKLMGPLLRTPEQGADTLIWLAVSPSALQRTGKFWLDRKERRTVIFSNTEVSYSSRKKLFEICRELSIRP
jgi:dehydrogenase/reductase SDR family member 12